MKKILFASLFLAGCSSADLAIIGNGLKAAGGGLDEGVYNQQRGLPPPAPIKRLDAGCYMDCTNVYSPQYCRSKCSY